ncbi:MAG: NADH:flavin oxidoreductase/NADH oxidase [Alphaproteobacteria bacterium]|nr:NADH:flavin oxidoreductase/NADH oxidase [Alphaproteobacteria bacterium]MCW5742903.1 NADH:flavin oxidoreductase/NADH oxidase [Alphaproteobacteria bacterium]
MPSVSTPESRPLLFTPLTIRGVTLPNRVVISPMVQYHARDGLANDFHVVHLGGFARGRAGLVFTEGTAVEPIGRVTQHDTGIWNDQQVAAFRRVVDFIHAEGAKAALQLAHSGRKGSMQPVPEGNGPLNEADFAKGRRAWEVVGPTTEPVAPGWLIPRALSAADIGNIVEAFAQGARRGDAAGFDVAEIHGAHGYLIASFLSPVSNTRNDGYGGDRAGRMRIALEITHAVRTAWPRHKPLFFRVSSLDGADGWNLDDTVALSQALKALGVDVVDCSSGGLTNTATAQPIPRHPGFQVPFASAVRNKGGVKSMAVGLILDGKQAEAVLQEGHADLVAIGRQALYDPFWALHAAQELGCDPAFAMWPQEYGWWLDKRTRSLVLPKAAE